MDEAAVLDQKGDAQPAAPAPRRIVYRHRLPTRIWHWVNALTIIVMLMSFEPANMVRSPPFAEKVADTDPSVRLMRRILVLKPFTKPLNTFPRTCE